MGQSTDFTTEQELRRLCRSLGLRHPGLRDRTGPRLRRCWRLGPALADPVVRAVVVWQAELFMADLDPDEQTVARYSLNLTRAADVHTRALGARHDALQRRRAAFHPSPATSRRLLARLLTDWARRLDASDQPLAPEAELVPLVVEFGGSADQAAEYYASGAQPDSARRPQELPANTLFVGRSDELR